jgi:hypothetical protein
MSEQDQERPCLHCMMVELVEDFFADYPATAGSDKVDTAEADEVIDAIAKTVAELTSQQDGTIRQQLIEDLMHAIVSYDVEFRSEEATGSSGLSGISGFVEAPQSSVLSSASRNCGTRHSWCRRGQSEGPPAESRAGTPSRTTLHPRRMT